MKQINKKRHENKKHKARIRQIRFYTGAIIFVIGFLFILKASGEVFSINIPTYQLLLEVTAGLALCVVGYRIGSVRK